MSAAEAPPKWSTRDTIDRIRTIRDVDKQGKPISREISPIEKAVLHYIERYGGAGYFATDIKLAWSIGAGLRSVEGALATLVNAGWLAWVTREDGIVACVVQEPDDAVLWSDDDLHQKEDEIRAKAAERKAKSRLKRAAVTAPDAVTVTADHAVTGHESPHRVRSRHRKPCGPVTAPRAAEPEAQPDKEPEHVHTHMRARVREETAGDGSHARPTSSKPVSSERRKASQPRWQTTDGRRPVTAAEAEQVRLLCEAYPYHPVAVTLDGQYARATLKQLGYLDRGRDDVVPSAPLPANVVALDAARAARTAPAPAVAGATALDTRDDDPLDDGIPFD